MKLITKEEVKDVLNEGASAIDRRLRSILREELGISDETKEMALEIAKTVRSRANELIKLKNEEFLSIPFTFKEKKIPLTAIVFHCANVEEEKELILTNADAANAYSACIYGGGIIVLRVPVVFVNGSIDILKFVEDTQHELSHIYQQIMSGEHYKPTEYEPALSYLCSSNEYERCLARIVYLCHPTEQDAYANGMYAYIMHELSNGNYPINKDGIAAYQQLQDLYRYYDFLQRNRDAQEMKNAIRTLNVNGVSWGLKKYLSRASEGIKEFERKIKRTILKCQKDARLLGYRLPANPDYNWLI